MLPLMTLTTTVLSPLVTPSPNGSVGTEIANEPLLVVVALLDLLITVIPCLKCLAPREAVM